MPKLRLFFLRQRVKLLFFNEKFNSLATTGQRQLVQAGREFPGSIELVRTRVEGVDYVRTVVQIPSMPSYVEQMLLDRLERKLRAEFGSPPEQPRRERRPSGDSEDEGEEDEGEDEGDDGDRRRRRRGD